MLPKVASPKDRKFSSVTTTHFKNNTALKYGLKFNFSSAKKVAKSSMKQVYQLKVTVILCSSSDRSDDDSDISILKFKPEDKDTIEKAKKALLARVRTQVSTSLMLPVYPYPECEPGQSQDGVQRPK